MQGSKICIPNCVTNLFRIHFSARMSAVNLSQKGFASPSRRLHSSAPREGRGNCDSVILGDCSAILVDHYRAIVVDYSAILVDYCVIVGDYIAIVVDYR